MELAEEGEKFIFGKILKSEAKLESEEQEKLKELVYLFQKKP